MTSTNYTTSVWVTLAVEGLHNFEGAVAPQFDEVSYLQYPHRHTFNFKVKLAVTHSDRDVEFIMFKHEILEELQCAYYDEDMKLFNFCGKSCEMLAQEIISHCISRGYTILEVSVDEDGENGAEMKYLPNQPYLSRAEFEEITSGAYSQADSVEQKESPEVIFIVGWTGAGKTTLAKKMASLLRTDYVEVSDLISKSLKGYKTENKHAQREMLAKAKTPDQVANAIADAINNHDYTSKPLIVCGLREYEVYRILAARKTREQYPIIHADHFSVEDRAAQFGMTVEEYLTGPEKLDMDLGLDKLINLAVAKF